MTHKSEMKLPKTVALIDAAYFNFVVEDVRKHFEKTLRRPLQRIDLSLLSSYLTLDAGLQEEKHEVQFIFVYDNNSSSLSHCAPSDLKKQVDGNAFQSAFGEYSFTAVSSEGMAPREELFIDLLSIVLNSADVKRIIVIPFDEEYGDQVTGLLNEAEGKDIFQFRMSQPCAPVKYKWDMLAFPVMHALGISADEL